MNTPPPIPRQKSSGGLKLAVVLLTILLVVSVLTNLCFIVGTSLNIADEFVGGGGEDEYPDLTETWSYGEGDVKAARIAVAGIIAKESGGGFFEEPFDKIEGIVRQVRAATHDEDVGAIILEVDSPGGTVTGSDQIYHALTTFKNSREDRKVVVHMTGIAASGGYYVAMAGDWLVAEPTTIVGSIGVIMQSLNWKVMSEKIGLSATTIKSGDNKDLLNPFEDVSPEQVKLLQDMIDITYERFLGLVHNNRSIEENVLRELADGRIFSAETAKEHTLIDQIGYWDEVVDSTASMLGQESVKVVRYEYAPDFFEWLTSARHNLSLASLRDATTPRMMFLWKP